MKLTEEQMKRRDELSKQYAIEVFPIKNIETTREFTQDVNFARRVSHGISFKDGYEAGIVDMQNQVKELENQNKILIEALKLVAFEFEFIASYQEELNLTRKQAKEALKAVGVDNG